MELIQLITVRKSRARLRAILSGSVVDQGPKLPIPGELGAGREYGANSSGVPGDHRMITGHDEMATAPPRKKDGVAHGPSSQLGTRVQRNCDIFILRA